MLQYRRFWLAGGWLLVALVVYLSLVPHPPEPLTFQNADKLEHCFAYGSLSLWFCQPYLSIRSRLLVMVWLIGLGVGLEFVQGWSGYRQFEVLDMVADSFGVLIGFLLVLTPVGKIFGLIESVMRKI